MSNGKRREEAVRNDGRGYLEGRVGPYGSDGKSRELTGRNFSGDIGNYGNYGNYGKWREKTGSGERAEVFGGGVRRAWDGGGNRTGG